MGDASPDPLLDGPPRAWTSDEFAAVSVRDAHRTHGCRILDVRDRRNAPTDHWPGSGWVPWDGDRPAPFLLPPRGQALLVCGPDAQEAARSLSAAGWPASWTSGEGVPRVAGPAAGALWDVDPLLARYADRLPPPESGPILDIGSGSSREGVYLAQRGHRVVLVDRLPDALEIARLRAAHHGVDVEVLTRRLRRADDLPDGPFAGVLDFRFLQRKVLEGIASRLQPGGWFLMRAYAKPDDDGGLIGRGPRNPNERLGLEEAHALLGDGWDWIERPRRIQADGALWITVACRKSA